MKFQKKYNRLHQLCFIILFCFACTNYAQIPQPLNTNQAVQDYVKLLSNTEQQALNDKLRNYADSTSTAIVIAILPSVEDNINFQAAQILSQWKIGQKNKDNGVLILMAVEQRKVAISTGYGIEEYLTDALSKQIIMQDIIPEFKKANYYVGFDKATTSIIQVLEGTYQREAHQEPFPWGGIVLLGILILITLFFSGKNQSNGNHKNRGFTFDDIIILSSLGRNSGGFGGGFGSTGGGFGGFGGGMGGGGGASGSW